LSLKLTPQSSRIIVAGKIHFSPGVFRELPESAVGMATAAFNRDIVQPLLAGEQGASRLRGSAPVGNPPQESNSALHKIACQRAHGWFGHSNDSSSRTAAFHKLVSNAFKNCDKKMLLTNSCGHVLLNAQGTAKATVAR
jgi:hypothetical protein